MNKFPIMTKDGETNVIKKPVYYPIGILIGQHLIESDEDMILVPQFQEFERDDANAKKPETRQRSTGLTVVSPLEPVIEALLSKEWQRRMTDTVREHHRESGYVPLSAAPPKDEGSALPTKGENPQHKEVSRLL